MTYWTMLRFICYSRTDCTLYSDCSLENLFKRIRLRFAIQRYSLTCWHRFKKPYSKIRLSKNPCSRKGLDVTVTSFESSKLNTNQKVYLSQCIPYSYSFNEMHNNFSILKKSGHKHMNWNQYILICYKHWKWSLFQLWLTECALFK